MRPEENEEGLLRSVALQNARFIRLARDQAVEAHAVLAAIVESSDDAIIGKDLNGIITSWNRGAERLFGYSAQEAIGHSITMIIPPDRLDEETRILEQIRRGESVGHYEAVRRRKDGSLVEISLTISPLINADGQIVGASKIARDISERKRAEEALARLAAIVEFSDDAIISKDLKGIIATWNRGAERLFGYAAEEVIGKPITILIPPERQDEEPSILERIGRGERIEHYETTRQRKDGSRVEISLTVSPIKNARGVVIGASKIARDITERRRTEQRLVRVNATLVSLMEAIPDILFVIGAGPRVEFRNLAANRFGSALGLADRLPPPIEAELHQVMQTGEHRLPTDYKTVHRFEINGENRYFLSRIVSLTGADKLVFGAVVMLQDVTNFRLLDQVKTDLISTVSHELKSPLTSLRTALLVLVEQSIGALNAKQVEMVTVAKDETERLLRMLNTLLDLTRFEEDILGLRLESVAPAELIRAALEETQGTAAKAAVSVRLEIEAGLPPVLLDREHILHVLTNFLTNAIKYSPGGGEVTLRVRQKNKDIYFAVIDRGPGVAPEFRSRIFEKFFRVPGTRKQGAGLGLSIARDFVRAHRGQIGVISEPGQGSEFYFTLPLG